MISLEEVKKFYEAVGRIAWNIDYVMFCKIFGKDGIEDAWCEDKWFAFQKFYGSLGEFSHEDLTKLLNSFPELTENP